VAGESFSGIPEETRVRLADGMEVDWPSSSRDPPHATRLAGQRPRVAMRRDRADRVPRWPRGDGRRLRSSGKFRREPIHSPWHVPQRERRRLGPTPAPPSPRGTNSRQRWDSLVRLRREHEAELGRQERSFAKRFAAANADSPPASPPRGPRRSPNTEASTSRRHGGTRSLLTVADPITECHVAIRTKHRSSKPGSPERAQGA